MGGRTPSFVVVGLALITFLVGFFYMSCSSKTTELRQTLDDFEERIRTLTLKNSDKEKELDIIRSQKHEIEQEKSSIQKQFEKKRSELDDLNTKFNEKVAELQSLKSDKQVLDEQLKQFQNTSEILASKNSAIDKLQQEYNEQKKSDNDKLVQLKQEIDNYKKQISNISLGEKSIEISNQRFQPLLSPNEIRTNTSSIFREPLAKLSNITNEIKEKIAPVVSDIKNKISNVFDSNNNSNINQNIPPPPLGNNMRQEQQPARNEPDREHDGPGDRDYQRQNRIEARERRKRLLDDGDKHFNDTKHDNQQDSDINNARQFGNRRPRLLLNELNNAPSDLSLDRKNYRVANRKESQRDRNRNGQNQVIDNNNQDGKIARGNIL